MYFVKLIKSDFKEINYLPEKKFLKIVFLTLVSSPKTRIMYSRAYAEKLYRVCGEGEGGGIVLIPETR